MKEKNEKKQIKIMEEKINVFNSLWHKFNKSLFNCLNIY